VISTGELRLRQAHSSPVITGFKTATTWCPQNLRFEQIEKPRASASVLKSATTRERLYPVSWWHAWLADAACSAAVWAFASSTDTLSNQRFGSVADGFHLTK
jgi:hypothetical protein